MDIITQSVHIKGTSNAAAAIIAALCNFGTPEEPVTPTTDEMWNAIKKVRNELLVTSDWTQLADNSLSAEERQQWAAYRQALRNLPQTYDNAADVVWPEPPNG